MTRRDRLRLKIRWEPWKPTIQVSGALGRRIYFVLFYSLPQDFFSSQGKGPFSDLDPPAPHAFLLLTTTSYLAPRTHGRPQVPTSSSGVVWPCAEAKGLAVSGAKGRG